MLHLIAKGINYLFGKFLQRRKLFLSGSLHYLGRSRTIDRNYFDYIRISTLELACYEIHRRGLAGSVAELGVFQGKFARHLNTYFPDRNLYLFDTFRGFDARDIETDRRQSYSSGKQDFSGTSVDAVLSRMPNPGKCIPVQGYFPASAAAVNEPFVLVSIDADLYEPIYQGLRYFFPRLVAGGYIFVHDVNNDGYQGARLALEQFCREENISFVPIPDQCGSAIIAK